MVNVFDVASYILEQHGPMTAMKLQKLTYYSQAWSLVWDEKLLFPENFQAWANGPVCYDLYRVHQQQFQLESIERGDSNNLNLEEKATVDAVLQTYGDKTAQWLSDLTHMEDPWKRTREEDGVEEGERSNKEINPAYMAEYYSGLSAS